MLDIRLFRSDKIRMQQKEKERAADDEQAYTAIGEVLALLRPEVVLVCQCQTSAV